jgi:hypothetical protein
MDGSRFDTLTRSLSLAGSRRRALGGVLLGALSLLGSQTVQEAAKKKKPCPPCKKRKQGKCKKKLPDGTVCREGTCQGGRCVAALPPAPSCCGGPSCPRCANGQSCANGNDCISARCVTGRCQGCAGNDQCGSDANGACTCRDGACFSTGGHTTGLSCAPCPPHWYCKHVAEDFFACFPPCGSSEICSQADSCVSDLGTCGNGGKCFQPLGGGPTRCGVSAGRCGCFSHQFCTELFGAGAFCVTFASTSTTCTGCESGTFCALPR